MWGCDLGTLKFRWVLLSRGFFLLFSRKTFFAVEFLWTEEEEEEEEREGGRRRVPFDGKKSVVEVLKSKVFL
jgi:hypothetical protein